MGLFGKTRRETVTCADVVESYGSTIERLASSGRQMHSAKELPYEKPLIEAALLALAARGDTSIPEGALKAAYAELATFRDGDPGVAVLLAGPPPSTREELAAFMEETAPKLATQAREMKIIEEETARRAAEWDGRLARRRNGADA